MSGMLHKGTTCPHCAGELGNCPCETPEPCAMAPYAPERVTFPGAEAPPLAVQEEAEALTRVVLQAERRQLLASIVLEHMHTPTSACYCGGMGLGESYPHRVADALIKAGL